MSQTAPMPRLPAQRVTRRVASLAFAALVAVATAATGAAGARGAAAGPAASPCPGSSGLLTVFNFHQPTSTVGSSGPDTHQCTPLAGATLTGSQAVDVDVDLASLSAFSLAIVPTQKGIPALSSAATVTHTFPTLALGVSAQINDTIAFTWDTTSLTPYNGVYEISMTATGAVTISSHQTIANLKVNNPPATPTGLAATLANNVPVVVWSPNQEPDLTGYQVLRSVAGGSFTPVSSQSATVFVDYNAPQGSALTYEVIATRASPVTTSGIGSSPAQSNPVTPGTVAVQPTAIPAPSIKPPPRVQVAPRQVTVPGEGIGAPDNTFAPTLPFGQSVPSQTVTLPSLPAGGSSQALPGDTGNQGGTTLAQKVRYVATALLLLVVAGIVIKLALRVLRSGQQ